MLKNIRALTINSLEPAFNLALEEYLFNTLKPDDPGFFLLWRNGPSIIVGRHQNAAEEINEELVNKYNLAVVRRMTGGGAVYHDEGNLNFSFILPRKGHEAIDFSVFLKPVLEALRSLGLEAEFSSRNDLTIGGRKFSGSAQRLSSRGVLHHGTILFNLDLDFLTRVLSVSPDKFLSKGVASIRERVANLAEFLPVDFTVDDLRKVLIEHCSGGPESVAEDALAGAEALAASKYRLFSWNFGASPPFTEIRRKRFPWGLIDMRLEVSKGIIKSCRFSGDFFSAEDLGTLEKSLYGIPRSAYAMAEVLDNFDLSLYFSGCDIERTRRFIISGLDADD